jgi:hypothetical protein
LIAKGCQNPVLITGFVSNSWLEPQLFDHHSHNNSSASQTVAACPFIFGPFSNIFSNLFGRSVIYPVRFRESSQFKNSVSARLLET